MERDVILDLALLPPETSKCPRCKNNLVKKTAVLKIGMPKQTGYAQAVVLFCSRCHDFYGTIPLLSAAKKYIASSKNKDKKKIRIPHHLFVDNDPNTGSVLANDRNQTHNVIARYSALYSLEPDKFVNLGGESVAVISRTQMRNSSTKRTIIITLGKFTKCSFCRQALFNGHVAAVPISETECVQCELSVCRNCDMYYSDKRAYVQDLAELCIDKERFWIEPAYLDDIQRFEDDAALLNLKSAYCRFIISTESRVFAYTIVTNRSEERIDSNVIHYCRPIALELLTAQVLNSDIVNLNGTEYVIQRCDYLNHEDTVMKILRPDDRICVEKRSNGGYYDPDDHIVLIDGLVFCEKSNHLELLRMSYDTVYKDYFVDVRLYQEFINQHGYPIVRYYSNSGGFGELRVESLLHQMGYNVNQKENLSAAERQQMLARFVDLGFVSVSSVVNLLISLIHRNGLQRPLSKEKWEEDLRFISNYKINHERFAFVERIKQASNKRIP